MNGKADKLNEELTQCYKIIKSVRQHYKSLETADFENLTDQWKDFTQKCEKIGLTEKKLKEFSCERMQNKIDDN